MSETGLFRLVLAALPVLALALNVVVQIARYRTARHGTAWPSLFEGMAAGMLATLAGSWLVSEPAELETADRLGLTLLNGLAFFALAFGYFSFVNLNYTSLRIRLLRELLHQDGHLEPGEVMRRYDVDSVIALRLERLTQAGTLSQQSGRYVLGPRAWPFLALSRLLGFLKWLMLGKVTRLPDDHNGD